MARTHAGADGFDDLFRVEYPALVRRVRLVVGSAAVAEEIAQDAFCTALERWHRVRTTDRPGAWIQVVALRRAISLAYDVRKEIQIARRGQAVPAQAPAMPGTSSYDPAFKSEMSDYDPARARALLDDWDASLAKFVKVMPTDYAKALTDMKARAASIAAE